MASSEAMTSSTHSFAYSYGLVKKCFLKICETAKFHNFLIFQPIFIRFSLFCSENFTLSSEIKLHQLRTSPLRTHPPKNSKNCGVKLILNTSYLCVLGGGQFYQHPSPPNPTPIQIRFLCLWLWCFFLHYPHPTLIGKCIKDETSRIRRKIHLSSQTIGAFQMVTSLYSIGLELH